MLIQHQLMNRTGCIIPYIIIEHTTRPKEENIPEEVLWKEEEDKEVEDLVTEVCRAQRTQYHYRTHDAMKLTS